MEDGKKLGEILRSLETDNLIEMFNGLTSKAQDDTEQKELLGYFADEYPGIMEFIEHLNDAEAAGFFEKTDIELDDTTIDFDKEDEIELGPYTYGMLLGFLVLREVVSDSEFRSMFGI